MSTIWYNEGACVIFITPFELVFEYNDDGIVYV
jgi:hypothetical protein